MPAPTVMVSSTFYDLKQIRNDLSLFIEQEMGYRALLSEMSSFPIDPDVDTIENCRRRVEREADILILVIGGRYGSIDASTAKSITNLEYLTARRKKIPIYAFVDRDVEVAVRIWKKNQDGDFSGTVDTPLLFEFVEQVRTIDRVWTQGFGTAQDVINGLRVQFAHLMKEGLDWRMHLRQRGYEDELRSISGAAFRIALERPEAWEYKLFAQVLADEVASASDLRREYHLRIALGPGESVAEKDIPLWIQDRADEFIRNLAALNVLMSEALTEALGNPGEPGNPQAIVFVAKRVGYIYRHCLEWAQRLRRVSTTELFKPTLSILARYPDQMVEEMSDFGPRILRQIDEALIAASTGEKQTFQVIMTLDIAEETQAEHEQEFARVMRLLNKE